MRLRPLGALSAAVLVLLAIAALLPNAPLRRVPAEDAGVFLYAAQTVLAGGMPYRDVWDHKPPGIYLVDVIVGADVWGVWALQIAALLAAAALSFRAIGRGLGAGALFGTAAWLLASPRLFLEESTQTNFPELFAIPLQFAALALFVEEEDRPAPSWRSSAIGALGGAAALLKPTVLAVWVAIALYLLVTRGRSGRWGEVARRYARVGTPAAAVVALAGLWLAIGGALPDAVDQVIRYNATYSAFAAPSDRIAAIMAGLRLTIPSGLSLLAGAGIVLAFMGPRTPLVSLAAITLPIELLFASAGRGYHYYFLPWLPSMGVLAAYVWTSFRGRFGRTVLPVLALISVLMAIVPTLLIARLMDQPDRADLREAAAYVASTTSADETALVWGSHAEILVLADRRAATRFIYQYAPLGTKGYASAERIGSLLAELERNPPALIVDASRDSFVTASLDGAPFESPEPQYAYPAELSRIIDFVRSRYERSTPLSRSGWPVWRRR